MKLTTYRYAGPPSCASLRVGKTGERLEVLLHPGQPVSMPADHEYTRVLLALKHLHPLLPNPPEKTHDLVGAGLLANASAQPTSRSKE